MRWASMNQYLADGVKRLILTVGRQIALASKAGQKAFELLRAGKGLRHGLQGADIMPRPIKISCFGWECYVLSPKHVSQPFGSCGQVHDQARVSRIAWDECCPRQKIPSPRLRPKFESTNRSSLIRSRRVDYKPVATLGLGQQSQSNQRTSRC